MLKNFLCYLLFISITFADPLNFENVLMTHLFKSYNRDARPIANVSQPVEVSVAFYLTKILNLDEKNQVLTTFGWLEVHWKDEFLTWNHSNYGGLTRIIVPPKVIWLPDFGLENSAETIYDEQADKKFRAGIDYDGGVQWVPGGKFVTSCELDITLYPFDSQMCEMHFVDWTYDGRFVSLTNGTSSISLGVYKKHGEWDILKTEARSTKQYFDSDPGIPFPTVKFVLHLRRKPKFYMINVVAPCLLMSILALLVFYLPPDSGEKVSLGITVLLSFSVFLLLIAENVPKTSDYVPLIGVYLTMVMVMTALSIVISVVILELHHHEPNRPVPNWLRRIVFGVLSKLMFIETPYKNESTSIFFPKRVKNVARKGLKIDIEEIRMFEDVKRQQNCSFIDESLEIAKQLRGKQHVFEEILQHLKEITTKMKKNIKREKLNEEWKMLAKIIDRFLLLIFLLAIIGLTLSILYIYPKLNNAFDHPQ